MRMASGFFCCVLTTALLAAPAPGQAGDFLHLDGVTGGSSDAAHRGWLDVSGYAMSVTATTPENHSSGAGASRPPPADITITRTIDQASPQLMQAARNGRRFLTAQLDVAPPAANARGVRYTFGGVMLSGYQASNGQETFTLVYQTQTQAPQNPYGAAGPAATTLHAAAPR